MNNQSTLGIYLHIPFCLRKCFYCDFCSQSADRHIRDAYIRMLVREIGQAEPDARKVDTLFIGGGIPSLLDGREVELLLTALRQKYSFAEEFEFSVEANPATVTREKAADYLSLGVNRISIGVQSMQDGELRALGRLHTSADAVECVGIFRAAGADNLNVDLMYGIPNQTTASFADTLQRILALAPEHLSAYSLILEEGTVLDGQKDTLLLPSEEDERAMYDALCEMAEKQGYRHYEISNYAQKGRECRHNLRYWQRADYRGFGLAAHSCIGGVRLAHTESLADYLAGAYAQYEVERLTQRDIDAERIMLGLRTKNGVSERALFKVAGENKRPFVERCVENGYLERLDGRLCPTDDGLYVSSGILKEILPDWFFHK